MTYRSILSIINMFLIGFLLGKYVQEEYYTPKPAPVDKTMAKADVALAASDSIYAEHVQSINRMSASNLSMQDLLFKYEVGLDYLRNHRPEAYTQFIRVSELREQYTEDIRTDFINEHRRVKRQAAQAFP